MAGLSSRLCIGVVADTHNRPIDLLVERLRGVEEIWHLGDVCNPATLDLFYSLGVPLRVVRGNNDYEPSWPLTLNLKRGGRVFHLVHIPPRQAPDGVQILLHGHTHVPRDETCGGVRYLNPGSAGLANKGAPRSFARLTLGLEAVGSEDEVGLLDWRIELL